MQPGPRRFTTTRWSRVLAARDGDSRQAEEALADLCRIYWYPIYAYVRRQGYAADEAQDLTQGFFAHLLARDFLRGVDPGRGRFRSFLLAACRNFLSNERKRSQAAKRGGGVEPLSLDFATAERRYSLEPAHALTPDKLFERRWAMTLLERVLARLRGEYAAAGRSALFEELEERLVGAAAEYAVVARKLGMTEGAVKVAAHRLRRRYRDRLRAEIGKTVGSPTDVKSELEDLLAALRLESHP